MYLLVRLSKEDGFDRYQTKCWDLGETPTSCFFAVMCLLESACKPMRQ